MKGRGVKRRLLRKGISPIRTLPMGYLCVVGLGTALLMLPAASHGAPLPFLDALFTATSASCVTGLVVVDTGTFFTPFGQGVLLLLIQVGGLGFMVVTSLLFLALGARVSLRGRMLLAEGTGNGRVQGVMLLCRRVLALTFFCELLGAVLLSCRFVPLYGAAKGLWFSLFHSVSAFCNAGFDLIGGYQSLMPFAADGLVNFTVMGLIVIGGLGYRVVLELLSHRRNKQRLSVHARVVLYTTALLIFGGAALFWLFEYNNPATLGGLPAPQQALRALFQSVTCRTAGFNTIDQASLGEAGKLLSCLLMFIGGAPAGTAGGVKLTTIALLLFTVRSLMRGRQEPEAFGRRFSQNAMARALCVFLLGMGALLLSAVLIALAERGGALASFDFIDKLYELVSALGTVGTSTGVTAAAGPVSRLVLCALMFMGRAGILTIALAFGHEDEESAIRYPKDDIMIG